MLNLYNTIKINYKDTNLLILKKYSINEMFIYNIFGIFAVFLQLIYVNSQSLTLFSKIIFQLSYNLSKAFIVIFKKYIIK